MLFSTSQKGGRLVIVNLQRTPLDSNATLCLRGKTDDILKMLMARLHIPIPAFRLQRRLLAGVESVEGQAPHVYLKTVDTHDPSLDLKLLRQVSWGGHQKKHGPETKTAPHKLILRDNSSVPVRLHWSGHYHEPPLDLKLDLSHGLDHMQELWFTYDPFQRVWAETKQRKFLTRAPKVSEQVREQQDQGRSYSHAHHRYCVDGIVKANPKHTRKACDAYFHESKQKVRKLYQKQAAKRLLQHPPPHLRMPIHIFAPKPVARSNMRSQPLPPPLKVPITQRPGEFKKVAASAQQQDMRRHVSECGHASCHAVWRGPWGPFIGGTRGKEYFDLTTCPRGAQLNQAIGWDPNNPRT